MLSRRVFRRGINCRSVGKRQNRSRDSRTSPSFSLPLAMEGGPLLQSLCYAQIGGLVVATFITLLLVPVFYAIFVLDLKWIKWEMKEDREQAREAEPGTT